MIPIADGEPFEALAIKVKHLPVGVFHGDGDGDGDADATISVEESRRATAALKRAGGSVTYTELPGVGQNAWDTAYSRNDVATWLFAQRRAIVLRP